MLRKFVLALAALTLLAAAVPARASAQVIVSGPGAYIANYVTQVVVVSKSAPLTYVNADILGHNVEATSTYGPDSAYWCDGVPGPDRAYPLGRCPLFWTPVIGSAATSVVEGISAAVVGKTYAFRCAPHPGTMNGILVIVP